ncbi:MAG: hypothetical protein ABL962_14350, partial [Fimbriimonadaceae bacterium]
MDVLAVWLRQRRLTKVGSIGAIIGVLLYSANSVNGWVTGDLNEVLFLFVVTTSALWAACAALDRSKSPFVTAVQSAGWKYIAIYPIIWTASVVWTLLVKLPPFEFIRHFPADSTLRIGALLPLVLGIGLLIGSVPRPGRVRNMLDASITTSSVAVFSWHFVLAPVWGALRSRLLSDWTALAYPIGAGLAVFLAITLVFAAAPINRWRTGVIAIGFGALAIAAAENVSTLEMLKHGGMPVWFKLFWPVGVISLALASH